MEYQIALDNSDVDEDEDDEEEDDVDENDEKWRNIWAFYLIASHFLVLVIVSYAIHIIVRLYNDVLPMIGLCVHKIMLI